MRRDEEDEDYVAEAQVAFEAPAVAEFQRKILSIRRRAGLDLKWWEKPVHWLVIRLRLKFRFK